MHSFQCIFQQTCCIRWCIFLKYYVHSLSSAASKEERRTWKEATVLVKVESELPFQVIIIGYFGREGFRLGKFQKHNCYHPLKGPLTTSLSGLWQQKNKIPERYWRHDACVYDIAEVPSSSPLFVKSQEPLGRRVMCIDSFKFPKAP